jgi:DNA-binding Lrp family transcriptional regulator
MALDLEEIDEQILDVLSEGRNVPNNIAERIGVTRQYVHQRLKLLRAADHVENIGGGVYELIDDPRDESADGSSGDHVEDLQERLEELKAERDSLQAQVERLEEASPEADINRDAIRRGVDNLEAACERGDGAAVQEALQRLREAVNDD